MYLLITFLCVPLFFLVFYLITRKVKRNDKPKDIIGVDPSVIIEVAEKILD